MRDVIVDYARAQAGRQARRGPAATSASATRRRSPRRPASTPHEALSVDAALDGLARADADAARIVELRYFGGLSVEETAAALGISEATVKRRWTVARAWLYRRLASEA